MEGYYGRKGKEPRLEESYKMNENNGLLNYDFYGIREKTYFDLNEAEVYPDVELLGLDDFLGAHDEKGNFVEAKWKDSRKKKKKEEYIKNERKNVTHDLEKQENLISSEKKSLLALKKEVEEKLVQVDEESKSLQVQKELLLEEENYLRQLRKQSLELVSKEENYLNQLRKELEQEKEAFDNEKKVVAAAAAAALASDQSGAARLDGSSSLLGKCSRILGFLRKASRKRAREDNGTTNVEAQEEQGWKRRQIEIPVEDPVLEFTPNEAYDYEGIEVLRHALDHDEGNESGDNFDQLFKATSYGDGLNSGNPNGDAVKDGDNVTDKEDVVKQEEDVDDGGDHVGKISVSRKIWNFLTT